MNTQNTDLTLKQAAIEVGVSYGYFRQIYTNFLTDNGVKIKKYPGRKKVMVDRKSFEFFRKSSVIN